MDYDNAVEGAENVIDCEKCYRLKSCGDRYYCAFIGLNPCIRGEHTPVQEYKSAANPLTSTDPRLAHLQEQQRRREEARARKETEAGKEQYKPHKTMKVVFRDIVDKHGGIPIFQPLGNSASSKAFDWSDMHTAIFEMGFAGWDVPAIAQKLNVSKNTLYSYIGRYRG